MNVSAKTKWKSVPMDPQLKARGFSEGLLGIEELCDYDLLKVKKNKLETEEGAKVTKKRKKHLQLRHLSTDCHSLLRKAGQLIVDADDDPSYGVAVDYGVKPGAFGKTH